MSLATFGAHGENLSNPGRVAIFSRSVPSSLRVFTRNWYTTLGPAGVDDGGARRFIALCCVPNSL